MVFVSVSESHIHLVSDSKHGFRDITFIELSEARLLATQLQQAIDEMMKRKPPLAKERILTIP